MSVARASVSIRMTFGVGELRKAFDCGSDTAHLDFDVGLRKTPSSPAGLDGGRAFDRLAEGLHRYARRRRNMCIGRGFGGGRRGGVVCDCSLLSVLYHLPRSLILPAS